MGRNIGINIVNDGLNMVMDPGNDNSYLGSGTVLNDLTKNVNLSLSLNTWADGKFEFRTNASYDITTSDANTLTDAWTICFFVQFNTIQNNFLFSTGTYVGSPAAGINVWFGGGSSTTSAMHAPNGTGMTSIGTINPIDSYLDMHFYSISTDNTAKTIKRYQDDSKLLDTTFASNITSSYSPNGFAIANTTSNQYPCDCDLGIFMKYDRVLTDDEIVQNFNALRGRYGI